MEIQIMKYNKQHEGCHVESRKLEMCIGPLVLEVVYSATYTPGEGVLDSELDLQVESIFATYEGCDYDEDAGPWLSQQAHSAIEAKCEQDFNDNIGSFRAAEREEYMAEQYAARQLYREVE